MDKKESKTAFYFLKLGILGIFMLSFLVLFYSWVTRFEILPNDTSQDGNGTFMIINKWSGTFCILIPNQKLSKTLQKRQSGAKLLVVPLCAQQVNSKNSISVKFP